LLLELLPPALLNSGLAANWSTAAEEVKALPGVWLAWAASLVPLPRPDVVPPPAFTRVPPVLDVPGGLTVVLLSCRRTGKQDKQGKDTAG
jgi:hypothetical protein